MFAAIKNFLVGLFVTLISFFSLATKETSSPPPLTESPPPVMMTENKPSPQTAATGVIPQSGSVNPAPPRIPATSLVPKIKQCLGLVGKTGDCLDRIFREFLKTGSTLEALALIKGLEGKDDEMTLVCHPIVHAIGRETFRLKGTIHDSFAACDQTCHSGCYHGAMERFLRGRDANDDAQAHISEQELKQKAATACDPSQPVRFRFQCLHGLGHALLFFLDYNLERALEGCDTQPDPWSRSSCYGGLFMENVFAADPAKRDLDPGDYHYPCRKLAARYQSDCYMMQTTRMSEMGLGTEQLFVECRKTGEHQYVCMQSIGRDLSNDARIREPRIVSQKCEMGTGEERKACARWVAYALLDNTWDGQYAFPFCHSFADPEDQRFCFRTSISYLKTTFAKSSAELQKECRMRLKDSAMCAAIADET